MSLLGRVVRFALLPAFRAADQVRESTERLRRTRRMHQEHLHQQMEELRRQANSEAADSTPAGRFEVLYTQRGWTAAALQTQLRAVRPTKPAALVGAALGTICGLVLLMTAPLWAMLIFVPAVAGLTALGLVNALKFGLFQAQLEQRELISLRQYLSRPDLFGHLLQRQTRSAKRTPVDR